ncbi:MAG TPA: hypothetical protein VFQ13_06225 [Anaerolineales bacterium]|nr:hypothetical protein [Anaerolineales bacterium]
MKKIRPVRVIRVQKPATSVLEKAMEILMIGTAASRELFYN